NLDNDNHIITIALDGENEWEYFSDSGEKFLSILYSMLTESKEFETTTFSEYLSKYEGRVELKEIYPGSWINADFDIWIGAKEENRAWSLLSETREILINFIKSNPQFDEKKIKQAWEKLYQAEGSDWFWWFDDDFPTDNKEEFDSLFRTHLKTIYKILCTDPPASLNIPIVA
ncbi:MAG TPA: alpha-amlyase, partial [Candidatus Atribacteria bacterium]|nr:alpha-amlyase [Candidatus Atribacteria bacterium]